jgi:hypothetical protein
MRQDPILGPISWKRTRPNGELPNRLMSSSRISHMHAEGRLLVLCARTTINEFIRVEVEDLASGSIDWELIWRLSRIHGVAPLAYRTLSTICPAAIPSPIHDAFRRHIQANSLLNTLLAKELTALLDAFASQGIRAIPFKGVTLAQTAYGDLSLRECADLDLIVDQGSISQARQVLWSQGYQLTSRDMKAESESDEPFHFFQKKNGIIAVDLQWIMARHNFGFRLDRGVFWDRLKPVFLPTKMVMGLCPEDLLILLCVHGSKHAWEQLKWICDVTELVRRRPALDWSRVLFQAEEWDCRRMVLLGLGLARNLFDTPLPRAVLHEIDVDMDMPAVVHRMPKQLLKDKEQGVDEGCADALYFILKDTWWGRVKLGIALCRDEAEVITRPLSWFRFRRRLRGLSFCLKPIRWMAKCITSIRIRQALVHWLQSPS